MFQKLQYHMQLTHWRAPRATHLRRAKTKMAKKPNAEKLAKKPKLTADVTASEFA
jgi:hypothetical protein